MENYCRFGYFIEIICMFFNLPSPRQQFQSKISIYFQSTVANFQSTVASTNSFSLLSEIFNILSVYRRKFSIYRRLDQLFQFTVAKISNLPSPQYHFQSTVVSSSSFNLPSPRAAVSIYRRLNIIFNLPSPHISRLKSRNHRDGRLKLSDDGRLKF